jgi:quinol monooxygenase YgiN
MAEHYASGTWQVRAGHEDEFVERWTEFLQWTRKDHPAMLAATLLRDRGAPGHFVSFAEWADEQSRAEWKQSPDFAVHFGACRALCEQMTGSDYDRATSV